MAFAQAPSFMDNVTLLQRQMEVSGSLREKITTPEALDETRIIFGKLVGFFNKISRLATKLQLPLEVVFQCLMQIGLGDAVNFDKQCRQGNVPMHQAKVLDRNASLQAQETEPRLRAEVNPEELDSLVELCKVLRTLVRMKVEDGNDLSMARRLITLSSEYLEYIYKASGQNPANMLKAYLAEDERQLNAAFGGDAAGGDDAAGGSPTAAADQCQPLPKGSLSRGVDALCTPALQSTKTPPAQRSEALKTLKHWMNTCPEEEFSQEGNFIALLGAMHSAMKVQLAEKRSVLCREACSIVTVVCLRSRPQLITHGRVKEIIHAWLTTLLSQVHVTVAAIAQASDTTVRDIIVSTQGSGFVVNALLAVLMKAAQAPLRKKCLGYVCLAVVASPYGMDYSPHTTAVAKFVGNSDGGCRTLARALGCLVEFKSNGAVPTGSLWDTKIEKLAGTERPNIIAAASDEHCVEVFEVKILGHNNPCDASAFFLEKSSGSQKRAESSLASIRNTSTTSTTAQLHREADRLPEIAPTPLQHRGTQSMLPKSQVEADDEEGDAIPPPSPIVAQRQQQISQQSILPSASSSQQQRQVEKKTTPLAPLANSSVALSANKPASQNAKALTRPSLGSSASSSVQHGSNRGENRGSRVNTPGVPLSLRGFSQQELSGSFTQQGSNAASPTDLTASLKARRRSGSSTRQTF